MQCLVYSLLVGLILSHVVGAAPVAIPLSNADFSQQLGETWQVLGAHEAVSWDAQEGRTSPGAVRMTAGASLCGVAHSHLIPVREGDAFKLLAWIRAEGTLKAGYPQLELLAGEQVLETPSRPRGAGSQTPGWVPVWHVLDVPEGSPATHMRITLRCDGGEGTVWFDDVSLRRLPPDRPTLDGPPGPPPHGVITPRDGQLVGDHGRRVRFWGINCVDEPGRTYREIDNVIRRIKAMGFNAIRLHLYDVRLIDPQARTEQGEPTSRLWYTSSEIGDGSLMDRFEYFIYRAEKAGLYLWLTLDRGVAKFQPGDYHILPSAGPEDEQAWKKAVATLNANWADEHTTYVDERLAALHEEYARRLLDHRNRYTGVRIGDDPYVALWELTNENGFPPAMLTGIFRSWPEYFQRVLQRRWNRWLQERYGSDERLLQAWGQLKEGESLEHQTVAPAPVASEADQYPAARLADFRRFVYDLGINHSRRLEAAIREGGSVAARTPISYDTIFEHKHAWYYPMSQGSFQAVGTYRGGSPKMQRDTSWLGSPPQDMYNYSTATVADKPIVVYENNIFKPAADRSHFPLLISTFASARDWDGVFWYLWSDGTVYDQVDDEAFQHGGLRYAARSHIWHGIVTSTDEVLLASLRLAGEIFTRFIIPPAPDPVILTVGAEDLFERNNIWIGDLDVPFPEDAPGPGPGYQRYYALGATDFLYTLRCRYDPQQPRSSVSRPLIPRTPEVCSPVPGLTYDFQRGVIVVDRPEAKAVVGFTGGEWDHGNGVRVEAPGTPFFCQGLVSLDGRPLQETERALLVFTTYGENRGMVMREDATALVDLTAAWGWGPPEILRPAVRFTLPGAFNVRGFNFLLQEFFTDHTEVVALPEGHELFWAELHR